MKITVYCSSSAGKGENFIKDASNLGKWIGIAGHILVYGGANKGLMGAAAAGV